MNLKEFLASKSRNGYIYEQGLSIYMRKGYHRLSELPERTLDLANINLTPRKRGKGVFTRWVQEVLEPTAKRLCLPVRVENIHNRALYKFLLRSGYRETVDSMSGCPTVFKRAP